VEEPQKLFFISRATHARENGKKNYEGTVVSARRLLQYFRLPNKNSRDDSRYIYNFLRCFKIVMYLFHYYCKITTFLFGYLFFRMENCCMNEVKKIIRSTEADSLCLPPWQIFPSATSKFRRTFSHSLKLGYTHLSIYAKYFRLIITHGCN
jgi:hypothetical protein